MPAQQSISLFLCVPFVVLLLLIAIFPLAFPTFWGKNRNKGIVVLLIAVPMLIILALQLPQELAQTTRDYFSFIVLLASLFIIAGGLVVNGNLRATPVVNTAFLLMGAIIANLIGTTGASMFLIRPLLRTNKERKITAHIPVFFIFVVSNIGGSLTPLGDPPLFLGFLRGVPFFWTLKLFPIWLVAVGAVLAVFFLWDTRAYRKEAKTDIAVDKARTEKISISGSQNLVFIFIVVAAVFLQVKTPYREAIMAAAAILSLALTKRDVRSKNEFTFSPIIEVAVLFAGIFVTMVPLLTLLREKGASLGITHAWQFFWLSGGLSSFLDNAPTYLTFSSLAQSVTSSLNPAGVPVIAGVRSDILAAISCGAVFMGANSYIGNGPNFMVKAIAEEQKVKVPHFFGYMAYSCGILIPIFLVITLVFFR
jgi:Na+/H+ antiporter NhaD/arsenite permease-like protein